MAKIATLGSALQDIFLIDDQAFTGIGKSQDDKVVLISAKELERREAMAARKSMATKNTRRIPISKNTKATKAGDALKTNAGEITLPKNSMKFVPSGEKFENLTIGAKANVDAIQFDVGGGGTNSAVTFARHGHETIFLGKIGNDIAGQAVLNCLDAEGIDSSYITIAPRKTTGCSIVLTDSNTGERTILTHRGASDDFDNLDEKMLDEIRPDWLYVSTLHGDFDTYERFFKRARKLGTRVMFSPAIAPRNRTSKMLRLFSMVDIVIMNKREAKNYVPGEILPELLMRLRNYTDTVIITDGQMGSIAASPTESYRIGIYEDRKVIDTTGAGDAFGSGFLAHFAAGKSFRQALIFGSANSTSVVSQLGAKAGILTGREKLHQMPIQRI